MRRESVSRRLNTGIRPIPNLRLWQALPTLALTIGVGYAIVHIFAAGPAAIFLLKNGALSGSATVVANSSAIGGSMVQFGSAPVASSTPTPSGLSLPRIPWEGGPAYWAQFAKANAAGWDDPNFFPISVFLGQMQSANYYKSLGINTYQAMEHNPQAFTLSSVTNTGMFVLAQQDEWTQAEIGNNGNVVGWFISDECEMGYSNCTPDWNNDNGEYGRLSVQQSYVNKVLAYGDGRFKYANFGNGILRTYWAPNTMDDHIALMDASGADKYTYTSPEVAGSIDGWHDAPDWPNGTPVARAYSYGWQADQMRRYQNPAKLKPIWTFVEFARPLLEESDAKTITPGQIEGAVWSAIIHEARGISYFMHNNDPACDDGSACQQANAAKVTAVNAKVKSLAPILNTQSYYNKTRVVNGFTYYYYGFDNGTDTMLKAYNGSAYIFADLGMGHTTGNKTFTLPAGVNGTTVTVVGEGRTIPVTNRTFSDSFANEYTHHVYQVQL